ncbi:MAG: HD domain-containing protein [Flavobacteriaceae bacterium]
MNQKNTLFNDPIYGFIAIDSELILDLINHPYFQRLRRISQMGLSNLVYPGAHHTRFEHAIGAMHIMQKAIGILLKKGISISTAEQEAMLIAILLHDIGHGPFSHATESTLLKGIHHEEISIRVIQSLNRQFKGKLDLALKIFTNRYSRPFMHQLVSGQVDVDRLDYLKRDSFYTGVTEGNINTDRILAMMHVDQGQLVFESKGVHSLEKFLLARRLMYWQVYLHKTSLAAELLLVKTLSRFRFLIENGSEKIDSSHLLYPFFQKNQKTDDTDILEQYLTLDDSDLLYLLKSWTSHDDFVLKTLSYQLISRKLPKIKIQSKPFNYKEIEKKKQFLDRLSIQDEGQDYFVFHGSVSNQMYISDQAQIILKEKSGKIHSIDKAIDYLDFKNFSTPIFKYYLCYPKPEMSQ